MIRYTLATFLFLVSLFSSASIQTALNHAVFYSPASGNYVETYIFINARSVIYKPAPSGFAGDIEVLLVFRKDTSVVLFDKYRLTPFVADTSDIGINLVDLQRKSIPAGTYSLEATVTDLNDPGGRSAMANVVIVDFSPSSVHISDIEMVDSWRSTDSASVFTRNGYDVIPGVINYYPTGRRQFYFYAEIYNSDKVPADDWLVTWSIRRTSRESLVTGNPSQAKVVNDLMRSERRGPAPVSVVLNGLDISGLSSGNYYFFLEVRNRKNELLAGRHLFFQRSNTEIVDTAYFNVVEHSFVRDFSSAEIIYCLKSVLPIASMQEGQFIDNLLESGDTVKMKSFFLNFWGNRDKDAPFEAWKKYALEVDRVNRYYGTRIYYGFETDMGRVYLYYGPPDKIFKEDSSPNARPYQIWHYYKTKTGESEVKFVFYNPDLVTNNYRLIHSNARGEIYDPNWQSIILYEQEGDLGRRGLMQDINLDSPVEDY